jgi:hypothetical protein
MTHKNNIVVEDGEYNKVMLGKEWHNGDFKLRLATKITYLEQYTEEEEILRNGKYEVEILAVSPEAAKENLEKAVESCGYESKFKYSDYLALIEYGTTATLFGKQGNNLNLLLKEANKELQLIHMLFGFYMDKAENRIGNTGWDFISGNIGFKSVQ